MSRRKRPAEEWRKAVLKDGAKPSIRLGLVYLADYMAADRKVSRRRELMAADLGLSERTIDNIIKGAHEAGLLTTVRPGRKHSGPAVYQGLFPSVSANPVVRTEMAPEPTSQREETQRAEIDQFLRAENPPLSGVSANHGVRTFSTPNTPDACPYHAVDGLPCPTDCRHHSPSSNEENVS